MIDKILEDKKIIKEIYTTYFRSGSNRNRALEKIESDLEDLKKVINSDDLDSIKSKTEALVQSSMKLGEAVYKKDQGSGGTQENSSDQEPSSDKKDGDEKVVDADFEEVDDSKKEQGDK